MKYITDHFFKNFSQKVSKPKWPLDGPWLHINWHIMLMSHVWLWLYPWIVVWGGGNLCSMQSGYDQQLFDLVQI